MMRTIAVVNEKGGTGKTTTAVNLSAALGSLGQRVLLVDLDGQAASSRWFGIEEDHRLADAMLRGGSLEPLEGVAPGVSLAPASGKLDSVAHDLRPSQGGQLRKVLKGVQDRYDLAFIDCPPSLGNRLIGNALLAATHAIVPVETSILALDGLRILLTTLEDIRDGFGHEIILAGVLACRYDGRTRLSRLVLEELHRALPDKVFNTVIRENVRMRECPASGESILAFAPDCHAAEDYLALAKEMLSSVRAWQEPAPWAMRDEDGGEAQGDRFLVDDLRNHAAASVRAAAQKAGWRKPSAPPAELSPEPAPPSDPEERDADSAGPGPWSRDTGQVAPGEKATASEAPSQRPALVGPPAWRDDTRRETLTACLARLAQAEGRLVAEEADPTPKPEQAHVAVVRIPEPSSSDHGAEPAGTGPPAETPVPAPPEQPVPAESADDQTVEVDKEAATADYPALRAYLRELGRDEDP